MEDQAIAKVIFKELQAIADSELPDKDKLIDLWSQLRGLLLRLSDKQKLHFSTLFARIEFVCQQYEIGAAQRWRIHLLRRRQYQAKQGKEEAGKYWRSGLKTVSYAIASLFKAPVPEALKGYFPEKEEDSFDERFNAVDHYEYMRVVTTGHDAEAKQLLCRNSLEPSQPEWRLQYDETGYNETFTRTVQRILRDFDGVATLNLLDVRVQEGNILLPRSLVLEPDYLMDVSAVAHCVLPDGAFPLLGLAKKFLPQSQSLPLMLGNIANAMLDELLSDPDMPFNDLIPKMFGLAPLAFALYEDREVRKVLRDAQLHYSNLRHVIKEQLPQQGIDRKRCLVEPSFFSERMGLQGRLDVLYYAPEADDFAVIELKSSRSVFRPNRHGINPSHYTQTILYDLLVRSVFGQQTDPKKYILYSGIEDQHLRYAPTIRARIDEALLLRNEMIAIEQRLCNLDLQDLSRPTLLDQLNPHNKHLSSLRGFNRDSITDFYEVFHQATPLERHYFLLFVSFIAREHRLAKMGMQGHERLNGQAGLWLDERPVKMERFAILDRLKLLDTEEEENAFLVHLQPTEETHPLANFRVGDIVVLYTNDTLGKTVLEHQIFKASLVQLEEERVTLRLRNKQLSPALFKAASYWAVEHDLFDSSYRHLYRSLFQFLQAPVDYRRRLLTLEAPRENTIVERALSRPQLSQEQRRILNKALSAEDYFLLVGPPGTGKTKFMLAELLRYWYEQTDEVILLMAYTNRAVDEICEAIEPFVEEHYLRIGSRFSTDERYRPRLLSDQIRGLNSRAELRDLLQGHRVFVATVASMMGKQELFKIQKIDRVIVDEASQILEPMLLGLLSHFKQFILIGDHKQLPAVVQQSKEQSAVKNTSLRRLGLFNRRNALFERLFYRAQQEGWTWAYDMLSHQGRMHASIAAFPSAQFYEGKLHPLPPEVDTLQWQRQDLSWELPPQSNALEQRLARKRLHYFPTEVDLSSNYKTNRHEAVQIASILQAFAQLYAHNGVELKAEQIGIITPFRAQIAQIRAVLREQDAQQDTHFADCTIDTVERYQGGARDIILLSVCLNSYTQLDAIVSLSDDEKVDRKLNVALTRARQQLVIVGNRDLLQLAPHYAALLRHIEEGEQPSAEV